MSEYKISREEYSSYLENFEVAEIKITRIDFSISEDNEPENFSNIALDIKEGKPKWYFPSSNKAVVNCPCEFKATSTESNESDSKVAFVKLKFTIAIEFVQSSQKPMEFYKIFTDNSLWRITFPFIREVVTNIPHRAGYIFPPPPLRMRLIRN